MKNKVLLFLLKVILDILSILPLTANRFVGRTLGFLLKITHSRMYATAKINLGKCFPELGLEERSVLLDKVCKNLGMTITESAFVWRRNNNFINKLIIEVEGIELLEKYNNQGVILTGPHIGNWELITFWAAQHLNLAAMYRKPKLLSFDQFLQDARGKTGASLIAGEAAGVKTLLKHLKTDGSLVILADQEPQQGSGVYASFFGLPAYTMTIVNRLLKKTNSAIILFSIIRIDKGFKIKLEELNSVCENSKDIQFEDNLNLAFENIIRQYPEQYQWSYKRFKTTPDGSQNFYYK